MIERHVVSLDLSRKLAAAGFPQECVLAWWEQEGHTYAAEYDLTRIARGAEHICAAPLLSEIMEQFGDKSVIAAHTAFGWVAEHAVEGGAIFAPPTGPDAAALLWLALRGEK